MQGTLVCKRMNEIITESPDINFVWDSTQEEAVITRNYRSIELRNLSEVSVGLFMSSMQFKNPNKIKEIKLKNCILTDLSLLRLLKTAPNLQVLTFFSCQVTHDVNVDDESFPELPFLTKLCIGSESWIQITNILKNVTSLKEFYFKVNSEKPEDNEDFEEYHKETEEETIVDFNAVKLFVQCQKSLEFLEIRNGEFFNQPLQEADGLQLKSVQLFIPEISTNQMTNLLSFVKTQHYIQQCLFNILPCEDRGEFKDCFLYMVNLF